MITRLIETKFHLPPWRPGSISRPRLLERLQTGLDEQRKLALISAPAGYGKTTLLAEWLHAQPGGLPLAWLTVDEGDNDPQRFMACFLAALRRINASVGQNAQSLLETPQLPPLPTILDELLNDLATLDSPAILALDDYHLLRNPQLRQALEYFSERQPLRLHLVIASREDPLLPLARLRARRQMTEIRHGDLRFSGEEAFRFFNQTMRLQVNQETADVLEKRTEGWATGLQLAALALENQSNRQDFVDTFRSSHRYVLDYLAEEVLHQQDEETRLFLIRTSILERFNAGECEALTGLDDCQRLLQRLEQSNLFVVPLDDERGWYRYHNLFAAYLRSELTRAETTELYRKASAWCEANELVFEAVRYALASKDGDFAAGVVERALANDATWSGGNLALLSSWLDVLPAQALDQRPHLSLNAIRLLYLQGRFEQAGQRIAQTEQLLASLPMTPEVEQMLALAALYRGSIAAVHGDARQAVEQITFAQGRIPPGNHLAHARAFFSLGLAFEIADQTGRSVQNYLQSSAEARSAGVLFLAIHARCAAAQVQIQQGCLSLAEQSCQAAIQLAAGARLPPLGLAWIVLGGIALERNDLASAGQLLQDGIMLSRQGGLLDDVILGLAFITRLDALQGNLPAAFAAIQEATSTIQAFGVERIVQRAAAYLSRLQIFIGQPQAAAQWAAEYRVQRLTSPFESEDLILARYLLATGDLETIPALLQPVIERASLAGRMQTCIEAMLLLGLFHQARKDLPSALDWLGKSLSLAAPEGYARIFLDEGQPLLDLLPRARPVAPEYVDSLLRMGQADRLPQPPSRRESRPTPAPVEGLAIPLSEQERRVLHLIVAGKSNQEIAAELVIGLGTAKWHVHNILQKLGVKNRPQAIARARQLGLA